MFIYIKKFIKKIISLFHIKISFFSDDLASPLTKDNISLMNEMNFDLNSFGELNKNKFFYVVRRSPGAGLFSNLIFVLNHLALAKKHGFIPFVDMQNFKTIYNEKTKLRNTYNSWEYYFGQTSKYSINEIYKSNKIILTNNKFYKSFTHTISDQNTKLFKIAKSSLKINKEFINEASIFVKKNFKGKTLGIHYRGTSYKTSANHPFPPTKKQLLKYCNKIIVKNNFSTIFLSTEDKNIFDFLKKKLGSKLCYINNSYRSFKDDAFKVYPRNLHRYKLGKEILIESLILSKCDSFICQESNVSEFIKFLDQNRKIKFYYFNNGFNSSNEYVAKWLWYYKNIMPKFLGGFE